MERYCAPPWLHALQARHMSLMVRLLCAQPRRFLWRDADRQHSRSMIAHTLCVHLKDALKMSNVNQRKHISARLGVSPFPS